MRELAKSLNSFSWAMSLFGAQQLLHFVRRPLPGTGHPAAGDLGTAARAGERQLGGVFERAFKAGDRVQRSAVDFAFGLIGPDALNPNRIAVLSADLLRQSTSALRTLLPGGEIGEAVEPGEAGRSSQASGWGSCGQPCGWGPMPPAT